MPDDELREYARNLFAEEPEDQQHTEPEPAAITDFLKTIFTN